MCNVTSSLEICQGCLEGGWNKLHEGHAPPPVGAPTWAPFQQVGGPGPPTRDGRLSLHTKTFHHSPHVALLLIGSGYAVEIMQLLLLLQASFVASASTQTLAGPPPPAATPSSTPRSTTTPRLSRQSSNITPSFSGLYAALEYTNTA